MNGFGMQQTAASTTTNIGKSAQSHLFDKPKSFVANTYANPFFANQENQTPQPRQGVQRNSSFNPSSYGNHTSYGNNLGGALNKNHQREMFDLQNNRSLSY